MHCMGHRRVPLYWWDFNWVDDKLIGVKIEHDVDYLPWILKYIPKITETGEDMIDMAERLIKDLVEGRADPRRLENWK